MKKILLVLALGMLLLALAAGCSTALFSGSVAAAPATAPTRLEGGLAILGDSFYDEYQGTSPRGGAYTDVTYNPVELLVRLRGVDLGRWGQWGEPRREGYEYNWARSGANSNSMISQGQHTSAAAQIAAGKVDYVYIGIGANDFNPYHGGTYKSIYAGTMSAKALNDKIKGAVRNVALAVDTVQEAGPKGVVITLFTQWDLDPALPRLFPDVAGRRRVAETIDAVNEGLKAMAAEKGVAVFDQNQVGRAILPQLKNGSLDFGGERISFMENGDEPHHARLADGQHLGTVVSGLSANYYFIDTFNRAFGLNIPRLTDEEILQAAGIRP
jgi:hypothetical protein